MRQAKKGWVMRDDEALPMMRLIDERVTSQNLDARHRDALIRLRAMIEDDVESAVSGAHREPKLEAVAET